MALPRRSGALFALGLLLLAAGPACASLMAIDLGSEYLRAVLVKPTARGSPLQIVVNEMSRRKSPALVGIAGQDRLLGEEAFSFAIRYPTCWGGPRATHSSRTCWPATCCPTSFPITLNGKA